MRLALVSLAAVAVLAGAAQAQPTDAPATPPPPPATTAGATTPTPATPTAPTTPAAPAPAPAAPAAGSPPAPVSPTPSAAAPLPAAPPAAPAAPSDPMAIQVLAALSQVCDPATNGGNIDQLARTAGYRRNRDSYVLRQPTFQITISPLSSDRHTCEAVFEYNAGPEVFQPTIVAVHEWALGRGMSMRPAFRSVTDLQRDIRSYERDADALALVSEKRPDGSSVAGQRDRSRFIYQRRAS